MKILNKTNFKKVNFIVDFAFKKLESEIPKLGKILKTDTVQVIGVEGNTIYLDNCNQEKDLRKFQLNISKIRSKMGELEVSWFLFLEPDLLELTSGTNLWYIDSNIEVKTFPLDIKGTKIVITGALSELRNTVEYRIKDQGGLIESSVTGKTDILLAGSNCGSKYSKAVEKKIPIFREQKFRKYLKEIPKNLKLSDII